MSLFCPVLWKGSAHAFGLKLSQGQKRWHPRGFNYNDPGRRKKLGYSHVPITPIGRASLQADPLRWLRRFDTSNILPSPSGLRALKPYSVAKDGIWQDDKVEEVERAWLELDGYR